MFRVLNFKFYNPQYIIEGSVITVLSMNISVMGESLSKKYCLPYFENNVAIFEINKVHI